MEMYRKNSDGGSDTEAEAPRAKEKFLNGHTNGKSDGQHVNNGSEEEEGQESNGIDTK